jgi:predicted amidohydrolase
LQDVTIAAIQTTSVLGDIESNLASIDRLLGDAVGQGADITCFPEIYDAWESK